MVEELTKFYSKYAVRASNKDIVVESIAQRIAGLEDKMLSLEARLSRFEEVESVNVAVSSGTDGH